MWRSRTDDSYLLNRCFPNPFWQHAYPFESVNFYMRRWNSAIKDSAITKWCLPKFNFITKYNNEVLQYRHNEKTLNKELFCACQLVPNSKFRLYLSFKEIYKTSLILLVKCCFKKLKLYYIFFKISFSNSRLVSLIR